MSSIRYILFVLTVTAVMAALPSYAAWNVDGNSVCNRANDQDDVEIIPDGEGGVIMVWTDYRSSTISPDIYAQRFNELGQAEWNPNGVAITVISNIQEYPRLASDGAGGAIIAWADNRYGNRDIYAQRVNASGDVQWVGGGASVCIQAGWQYDARVVSDGAGGAIIAWVDKRSGTEDIYAQRIGSTGTTQWTLNGVPVCSASNGQEDLSIAPDGAGGAVLVWEDYRTFSDVYAQRIDASGNPLWTVDGVMVGGAANHVSDAEVCAVGDGGAIVAWVDFRDYYDIYVQRVSANGAALWTYDGLAMCASATGWQRHMRLVSDGEGGAIAAFMDDRVGNYDYNIYAQRVDSLGAMLWGTEGASVCTDATGTQFWPDLIDDGAGGAIITWEDNRSSSTDIMAQRIMGNGSVAWTIDGISISSATGDQRLPRIASGGTGGAYITWPDERYTSKDIFVNHVNMSGLVPTVLAGYWTSSSGDALQVRWQLSEKGVGLVQRVYRAREKGQFEELTLKPQERDSGYDITDFDISPGVSYRYRVVAKDNGVEQILFTTEVLTVEEVTLALKPNYPNPFNPSTTISFVLPKPSNVRLEVFDVNGRRIVTLVDRVVTAGSTSIEWNGLDTNGRQVSSGVYLARLTVGNREFTSKMVLTK